MDIREMVPWNWGRKDLQTGTDDPFHALQRNMNEMFDSFFKRFDRDLFAAPFDWADEAGFRGMAPKVNVSEKGGHLLVEAELPGLTEKDIDVSVSGDVLTLKGERKTTHEEKEGGQMLRREFSYGSFRRSIPLPGKVLAEQVAATFRNGVLNIDLPLHPDSREAVKKIEVKGA